MKRSKDVGYSKGVQKKTRCITSSEANKHIMDEIDRCREQCNLPPLKRGDKICVRCEAKFYSDDKKADIWCPTCKSYLRTKGEL